MYVVIFRYGTTEVESLWTHDTRAGALAEASCAAEEGADEAWIEERA